MNLDTEEDGGKKQGTLAGKVKLIESGVSMVSPQKTQDKKRMRKSLDEEVLDSNMIISAPSDDPDGVREQ
jgi:hypothetical protein